MRVVILFVALAATACTADLQLGDPQVNGVCLNDAQLQFDGGANHASIDLGPLDLAAPEGQRVTLASATVTATTGVGDLGFADHVHVALIDADGGDVTLADATVSAGVLELAGDPAVDLGAYLRAGADRIEVTITGDMPAGQWTASVDVCFDVD